MLIIGWVLARRVGRAYAKLRCASSLLAAEMLGARGHKRILTDILARAGSINLARLATLGLHHAATGWAIA